jgi:hypothetical protein
MYELINSLGGIHESITGDKFYIDSWEIASLPSTFPPNNSRLKEDQDFVGFQASRSVAVSGTEKKHIKRKSRMQIRSFRKASFMGDSALLRIRDILQVVATLDSIRKYGVCNPKVTTSIRFFFFHLTSL